MAFTHVQAKGRLLQTSQSSMTLTFDAALTVGNLAVIGVDFSDVSRTLSSVTDDKGNTYTILGPSTGTNARVYQAYSVITISGATIVTMTLSGTSFQTVLVGDEFSGNAASGVAGLTANRTGGGGSTSTSVISFSPTVGSLIVATIGLGDTAASTNTAGANYTIGADPGTGAFSEYRLSSGGTETAPSTYTPAKPYGEWVTEYLVPPVVPKPVFAGRAVQRAATR